MVFYYKSSEEKFSVEIKSNHEKFCFRLKGKPLFFRIDPDYECPCKVVVLDVSRPMLHEQLKRDPDPIGRLEAASALTKKSSAEDIPDGETTQQLSTLAKTNKIFVHGGSFCEKAGNKIYNTTLAFDRSGEIIAQYRKIHLFDITTPDGNHIKNQIQLFRETKL